MQSSDQDENDLTIASLLDRLNEVESQLVEHAREVEHLQRLATIGTLAAGVVHEMNNQLTPALAQAQLARLKSGDPDRLRSAIDQCITGIGRAGRIAETLMGFAAPEPSLRGQGEKGRHGRHGGHGGHGGHGRQEGVKGQRQARAAANIASAVNATIACLGGQAGSKGVKIETHIPSTAWAAIEPLALQQVLMNLLLNAINALSDTVEPKIWISAQHIDGNRIVVSVEDNGPGVSPSLRPRLFRPFATQGACEASPQGTGLGLAVSRRLLERAEGSLTCGTSQAGGARFELCMYAIVQPTEANVA